MQYYAVRKIDDTYKVLYRVDKKTPLRGKDLFLVKADKVSHPKVVVNESGEVSIVEDEMAMAASSERKAKLRSYKQLFKDLQDSNLDTEAKRIDIIKKQAKALLYLMREIED